MNCLEKVFKDRRSVTFKMAIPFEVWSIMLPELKKAKTLNELGLRIERFEAYDLPMVSVKYACM